MIIIIFLFGIVQNLESKDLSSILKSGQLKVAFTEKSFNGIHRDLAEVFANHLNVKLVPVILPWKDIFSIGGHFPQEVVVNPTVAYDPDVFQDCDLICNSITILPWREKLMDFIEIFKVTELLITPENKLMNNFTDLKGKRIIFLERTTFEQHMNAINKEIGGGILLMPRQTTKDCYDHIINQTADGLVLDSDNALRFMKQQKGLGISFPVGQAMQCGWGVKKNNHSLKEELNNFFMGLVATQEINPYFVKHFGINYETYEKIVQAHGQKSETGRKWKRDLDDIIASKELIIAVRKRPFVYQEDGKKQFNHALALAFAEELGVKAELIEVPSFSDYWKNDKGEIIRDSAYTPELFKKFDIACDVIEPLDWRLNKADILSFFPLVQTIIALKNTNIQHIDDLNNFQGVTSQTSTYEELLQNHRITNYHYANVSDFVSQILSKKADYAVVENGFFYTRNHPEIQVKLVVGKIKKRGWAIKKDHPKLKHKIYEFFEKALSDGRMDKMLVDQTGISFKEMKKFTSRFHWKYQTGQFSFIKYTKDQGLPQEQILSIFQDQDSIMWFGTKAGVVRYNGKNMKLFDVTDGLIDNIVLDINQDHDGNLYFGTSNGLSMIKNGKIETILSGMEICKILIDSRNNKWLLGDELLLYSHNQEHKNVSSELKELKVNIKDISLHKNHTGILLATTRGTYFIDETMQPIHKNNLNSHAICMSSDNNIWMASEDMIFCDTGKDIIQANERLNLEQTPIKEIKLMRDGSLNMLSDSKIFEVVSLNQDAIIYDSHVGIMPATILSLYQDNEFNLWIGFMSGVQKLTNVSLRAFYPEIFTAETNQFFQDQKNRIWMSGSNGVYCFKDSLIDITPRLNVGERKCYVAQYGVNTLIANVSGLYELDTELKLINHRKFSPPIFQLVQMSVSPQKEIFLVTAHGVIYYLKDINSFPKAIKNKTTYLTSMLIHHNGNMIGGNAEGLMRFENNTFVQEARLNVHVRALYSDGERLWLGTDKGFALYENNQLQKLSHMKKIMVYAITPEKNGPRLFLGTDKGFLCFNTLTRKVEFSMDQRDGMPDNRVCLDSLFVDRDNILWVGTYQGISLFDITKRQTLKFKPKCHIENIFVNGKQFSKELCIVKQTEPETLSWNQNNLMFELVGLSFKDEDSITYDYYIRGLTNYYDTAENRLSSKIVYNNLQPGSYDFHFRAKGKDNIWSDYQSYNFVIEKPYWKTIYFYISLTIGSILMIWLTMMMYAKVRLRRSQKLAKFLKKQVKERTYQLEKINKELSKVNAEKDRFFMIISQDLRNPFSALMGLSDLLESYYEDLDDSDKKSYIHEIYETTALLNKLLENLERWSAIQNGKIPVEPSQFFISEVIQEHLQIYEKYGKKKKITLQNKVKEDITIFADANLLMILVDNLLSNAIKYSNPESRVILSAKTKGNQVELCVIDEGVGIHKEDIEKLFQIDHYYVTSGTGNEKGTGLGLLISKLIVEKNDGSIEVISEKGKGSTFKVKLPSQGMQKYS